jgi:hypothetical protein
VLALALNLTAEMGTDNLDLDTSSTNALICVVKVRMPLGPFKFVDSHRPYLVLAYAQTVTGLIRRLRSTQVR